MKALFFLLVFLAVSVACLAQKPVEALQGNHTLRERYLLMKTKSQTYGEYKVIKETTLDGVWRILLDSIAVKNKDLGTANTNITNLKGELNKTVAALKEKEQSMTDVLHDSTHISVAGIDFTKGAFISMAAIVIAGLVALLVVIMGRMKLQSKALSEKNLAVNALTSEFDEYKHRAMDKQTKLSRELQDERNKVQAMIRNT